MGVLNQGPHTSEGPTSPREILTLLMSGGLCAPQKAFCAQGCPVSAGHAESVHAPDASLCPPGQNPCVGLVMLDLTLRNIHRQLPGLHPQTIWLAAGPS